MAASIEQFVENVSSSGLMSADEVSSCRDTLPADKSNDVQELAKTLVREKKLTKYQVQAIYQGKQKGLKFGEYTVLNKLGEGGMGVVLRARHGRMEREVAIKVLPAKALKSETAVDRFYKEVRAAAKLIHPNIVTAFDASEHAGTHYLVLEFVDGKDLSEILKEHGPLPIAQAVECTIQAARGLDYAHSKGLIHRDIKPANLLLDKDGTVKILDLGLARLEQEHASRDDLTKSGQIMGTVDYMSPEQARDTKHADARSDIYSLGCTLYRLLTGMPVYDGDSIMNKMISHAGDPIPSLTTVRADVPRRLDTTFQKMLAKQPDDRQPSMTDVIVDLQSALSPDAPPERRVEELSSDSALTEFFANLNTGKPATATKKQTAPTTAGVEETIDYKGKIEETIETMQPIAAPSTRVAPPPVDRTNIARPKATARAPRNRPIVLAIGGGVAGGMALLVFLISTLLRDDEHASSSDRSDQPPLALAPFSASKAVEHQRAWANWVGGQVDFENSVGMKFRLIPAGDFQMGSTSGEIAKYLAPEQSLEFWEGEFFPTESPRHPVRISHPFYLGTYEVTNRQFEEFVSETKTTWQRSTDSADENPAGNMTLAQMRQFCDWLSNRDGFSYRLPTEAEWEYACRAGTTTPFSSGDSLSSEQANFNGEFPFGNAPVGPNRDEPTIVGSFEANAFGMYDMHGNVWETCSDWFSHDYYSNSPGEDPLGPANGSQPVLRGGDYQGSRAIGVRSATRLQWNLPFFSVGFRVVRDIVAAAEPESPARIASTKDATKQLLNGHDLTGWQPVGDANLWRVQDSVLTATGVGTGWLSTEQEYDDFVLDLEYRLPARGNSGVFLRTLRNGPINGGDFIEVQLYDDGVPLNNGNHTGSVFNIAKLEPTGASRPAGQWNAMQIRADGSLIKVTLNGQAVQNVDLSSVTIPARMATSAARSSGFIGLQCLGTTAEFRNIRLREL